ncbi:hypothetical protein NDU88_004640 [Pleurodeles waltl]|uniref:Uncharacterized protein n=1 Tax=Pleurodeles waltl TaxID=8319 RepID=A0AAV7PFL3_PLEWA|nr:hypothetical protein NDU88_004640 [Pleurodeles waltl]
MAKFTKGRPDEKSQRARGGHMSLQCHHSTGYSQSTERETGRVEICKDGTMTITDQAQNLADDPEQSSPEDASATPPNTE